MILSRDELHIQLYSFGFSKSLAHLQQILPMGGHLFDCRVLPNPYWEEPCRELTGQDKLVCQYFEERPFVQEYIQKINALVDNLIRQAVHKQEKILILHFGCTGGQHRSVYVSERVAEYIASQSLRHSLSHVELHKGKIRA